MDNPVRVARHRMGKTMEELADSAYIHLQVVFLTEHGTYNRIPPTVLTALKNVDPVAIQDEYREYQKWSREHYGRLYHLEDIVELGPPGGQHPVVAFRTSIGIGEGHPHGLSRMAFCKEFCVHSAEMYSLERGIKFDLSEQFRTAMQQAGLRDTVLAELEFRCQEYARGEWNRSDN